MSTAAQWTLIIVGLIAIPALAWLIRRQWTQLKGAHLSQEKTAQLQKERRDKMIDSIRIIASVCEQQQVESSEACIRIKGLLDHVQPELLGTEPYVVFQVMYEKTEHMPTHEARQQTDKKTIRKLDQERFQLEEHYAPKITEAVKAIQQHDFDQPVTSGGVQSFSPPKSTIQ